MIDSLDNVGLRGSCLFRLLRDWLKDICYGGEGVCGGEYVVSCLYICVDVRVNYVIIGKWWF